MEKLIKENLLYFLIVAIALFGGIYAVYFFGAQAVGNISEVSAKKEELVQKQQALEQRKAEKERQRREKTKKNNSGKVIYEISGQQFSPEASFGIMFENVLSNVTNSGLRIRSIDYNYSPNDDKILQTNIPQYHACELSFVAVGNYSQLQTFFKNIAKENYLTSIAEIYLEPYDRDKTILISRFKIRLYTKII